MHCILRGLACGWSWRGDSMVSREWTEPPRIALCRGAVVVGVLRTRIRTRHMAMNSPLGHREENGLVEVEKIPNEQGSAGRVRHLVAETLIYTWRPPDRVRCKLPDGFELSLECWVDHGGGRRFRPRGSVGEFVFEASLGGHAILVDRGEADLPSHLPYWYAHLFNRYIRSTREHLGPTINWGAVLRIPSRGRPDSATTDILPDDLGLGPDGRGERWTPGRLM